VLAASAMAAPAGITAMQAVKLLPKDVPPRLARIAGFEGGPVPERWHILVHDTREENGLHEYVVANGEIVASRAVSQFAEELKSDDIIGADAVKIDSDRAASIALQYAEANKLRMVSCNYELKKDGEGAVPLWRITCLDAKGEELGQIQLTATRGNVVRHEGFPVEPSSAEMQKQTAATSAAAQKQAREMQKLQQQQVRRGAPLAGEKPPPPPPATPEERPGFFQRAGSSVGRIFGGRN